MTRRHHGLRQTLPHAAPVVTSNQGNIPPSPVCSGAGTGMWYQQVTGWVYPTTSLSVLLLGMLTLVAYFWQHAPSHPHPSHSQQHLRSPTKDYQAVSFLQNYSLPWQDVLNMRLLNMQKYSYPYNKHGIDRRSKLSLHEFWDVYDGKWPVLITDVVPEWPAFNWSRQFLLQNYGKERVVMKAVDHLWDTAISSIFSHDLELITHGLDSQLSSIPSKGSLDSAVTLALPMELFHRNTHQAAPKQWTYIEDELFIHTHPELRRDIRQTAYLEEDFYQEFPTSVRPWNAMLLWGTRYSRSSLHMDPYNWTGTNAVLSGRKQWKIYPPGQDDYLYVKRDQRSGFPLDCFKYNSAVDAYEPDIEVHPAFSQAKALTFDQLPGELLIIPTGWFHQAYNTEETLAISSQVMNRHNHRVVLEEILKAGIVSREDLFSELHWDTPVKQVQTVMSLLSEETLMKGRQVTDNAMWQINEAYKLHPQHPPLH